MTKLRERMIGDLKLRNFSEATIPPSPIELGCRIAGLLDVCLAATRLKSPATTRPSILRSEHPLITTITTAECHAQQSANGCASTCEPKTNPHMLYSAA
ncbi:MAG: hypothetical protein JO138_04405 [Acidobacteriaceae bacterium]|nr:hypothetical protein [Acidobacteriaceae bacterium]MBV9498592.1 hypothetical protein [Acidobacteriaceae bacterium]